MNIKKRILVQNRLQQLYRFGIIVLVSLLIVACQPSYTVDQTKLVGREIGLMDKYSISRQHSRVINAHSHLSVITKPIEDQKDGRICAVVAGSFQPYFGSVNCARDLGTLAEAVDYAKTQSSDFLLYVIMPAPSSTFFGQYKKVEMMLVIVDVNTGRSFDKVLLKVKVSFTDFMGDNLKDLLGEGLTKVAKDLSGYSS